MSGTTATQARPSAASCPFEVIDEIAAGGMGTVYRAVGMRPPFAGRVVALKRLHPHLARDAHVAAMFVAEARVLDGLRHPNVVEVLDSGSDASGSYIALQYVPGVPLSSLLTAAAKAHRTVPLGVVVHLMASVAEGLHAAHELTDAAGRARMLVHRDVSPQNILVGTDGAVVLVDFGVAKVRDAVAHTRTGVVKGKPAYMSPEQVQGHRVDRRTDVFALGVVLWETLTLRRLYRGENDLETLRKVLGEDPDPVGALRNDVGPELERLVAESLAKDPAERVQTGAELARRLRVAGAFTDTSPGAVARFVAEVLPESVATLSSPVVPTLTVGSLVDATRERSTVRRTVWRLREVAVVAFAGLGAFALGLAMSTRARHGPAPTVIYARSNPPQEPAPLSRPAAAQVRVRVHPAPSMPVPVPVVQSQSPMVGAARPAAHLQGARRAPSTPRPPMARPPPRRPTAPSRAANGMLSRSWDEP